MFKMRSLQEKCLRNINHHQHLKVWSRVNIIINLKEQTKRNGLEPNSLGPNASHLYCIKI